MLVQLEPVWQCAEEEKEDGKAVQHQGSQDTARIPDFSGSVTDKTVCG